MVLNTVPFILHAFPFWVVICAREGVGEDDFWWCRWGRGVLARTGFDLRAHEGGVEGLHYDHVAHSITTAVIACDFALIVSNAAFLEESAGGGFVAWVGGER